MKKALATFNLFYDQLDKSGNPKIKPQLISDFGNFFDALIGGENV